MLLSLIQFLIPSSLFSIVQLLKCSSTHKATEHISLPLHGSAVFLIYFFPYWPPVLGGLQGWHIASLHNFLFSECSSSTLSPVKYFLLLHQSPAEATSSNEPFLTLSSSLLSFLELAHTLCECWMFSPPPHISYHTEDVSVVFTNRLEL